MLTQLANGLDTGASGHRQTYFKSEAQQQPEIAAEPSLELGKAVERRVDAGQTQRFQIIATAGQFVGVTIQQHGIDVAELLFAPDGAPLARFDNEFRLEGQERAEFVTETAGLYRLEIKGKSKNAAGLYEIRITETRSATEHDRRLFEALRLDTRALDLLDAGKYSEALPLEQRALAIREQELGPEHALVADTLVGLGFIKHNLGDEASAEQLYQRGLAIYQKTFGPDHPQTGEVRELLGSLYSATNQYQKAEEFFQQAAEIFEKTLGAEHEKLIDLLLNTSNLHWRRGDKLRAEQELQRARVIAEKTLEADDFRLFRVFNNLGALYNSSKDYDRAEPLLQRALEIQEKKFGPESTEIALPLQNLALIAQEKRKDYARALELYWRVATILEKAVGSESPSLASVLNNIGNVYKSEGAYAKALELHNRVYAIYEKAYGPHNGLTLISLGNIAKTYAAMRDVANAIKFQTRTDEAIEANLALNLAIGSERQKLAYFDSLAQRTDRTISLHVSLAPHDSAARDLAALVILQRKGRVVDAMSDSLAALRQRLNGDEQVLVNQLNNATAQRARLELNGRGQTPETEFSKQVAALVDQQERLEAEVSRRSAEFRAQAQPVTLAAVRAAVPPDAALIEFAIYRPFDPQKDGDEAYGEPHYIAYLVKQQGEVQWQELGAVKEIDARIDAFRQGLRNPLRNDVRRLARHVDEKVMQPLRPLLGSAKHLLISPDGLLSLIPFAALVDQQEKYLVEAYAISYVTSGRDLLRLQVRRESKSPPVVVADPTFGEPALVAVRSTVGEARLGTVANERARFDYSQIFFGPLPGVGDEVRALRKLLPQATFLTKEQATKAALQRVRGPSILHIATHGFFLQGDRQAGDGGATPNRDDTRLGKLIAHVENPLLRSGLALAGANQGLKGDDNGVLTALEAVGLDLWGTKLVVLSACDTGIGEVKSGDGVYGLRRAFVLAGAESQLMSLWPVSDRSTRDLMISYYEGLVQAAGRGEALRRVQLKMLRDKAHSHPYYWASFIQTGEWANLEGQR